MTKKDSWETAEEFLARLSQDPEYQRRMAERDEMSAAREARVRAAIDPVIDALKSVGVFVEEWNDLVSRHAPLPHSVVELLLALLPSINDVDAQEMIVRALTAAPTEHFDGRRLARLFETTQSEQLRWAIGNTLAFTQPVEVGEWILRTVQNPVYGDSREMLAIALAHALPPEEANPVLVSLLQVFPGHAAEGLATSGTLGELSALEVARERTRGSTRKQIAKAIRAIERRYSRRKHRKQ